MMRLVGTYPLQTSALATADPDRLVLELFHAHADGVFRLAMLTLGRTAEAEDIVQETFLRLLRHVTSGRPLPNARGWIYTVAAHACRDRQRAARRWLRWLPERDMRPAPDRTDAADTAAPIETALARLTPRDRLLITLRARGLSYDELAGAAGLRAASVGRTLARALERLTREIDRLGARP